MKKLILVSLLCYTLSGCFGCDAPIQGHWKSLPVRVCTEDSVQDTAVNDFNKGVGFEFYSLSKNDCQVIIETKDKISDFPKFETGKSALAFAISDYNHDPFPIINHSRIIALPKSLPGRLMPNEDPDRSYKITLEHELGHAAGHFFHSQGEGDLMYKYHQSIKEYLDDDYTYKLMKDEFIPWMNAIYPH